MKQDDIFVIDSDAKTYEEVIHSSGKCLYENGYVKDNFADECIKREQIFPTGLPTITPIAIPHCGSQFVEKEGLCVIRLKEGVKFNRMDDITQSVTTSVVFNLALKTDEEHIVFLQKFVNALGDPDRNFVKDCMNTKKEDVPQLFTEYKIL